MEFEGLTQLISGRLLIKIHSTMKYSKQEKEQFIKCFRAKTKRFAVDIINLCGGLPKTAVCKIITYQLVKSASSTGANYRAACRGRSQKEFYSKLSIAIEEADESEYWLELI